MPEITLNAANFEAEVVRNPGLILVDFWAEWCGPCKMMGPILSEVSQAMADKPIVIAKCNVDENPELTEKYGIMSIPAFKVFKNGEIIDEWVGAQTKENLIAKLEKYLI
jgi:thioredoxin 1